MKSLILLLTTLLLTATSWSQEELQSAPVPDIPEVKDDSYIYSYPDIDAEFPDGVSALKLFIANNIQYPEKALKQNIGGKCFLQFIIEKDGTVTNPKIIRGVPNCSECDAEALRVIRLMPKWKPGEVAGKPVRSSFNLPIVFKP